MAGEDRLELQSRAVIQDFSHSQSIQQADPQLARCLERALESTPAPEEGVADAPPPYSGGQGDYTIAQRYRTLYEPDADHFPTVPEEPDLDIQHAKLADACREFRDFLREKQAKAVKDRHGNRMSRFLKSHSSSKYKDSATIEVSPAVTGSPAGLVLFEGALFERADGPIDTHAMIGDVKTVIDGVYGVKATNEEKRSKACKYWQRFCRKLDAHSMLFSMVPRQNQYVAVFAGAVQVLVQVC